MLLTAELCAQACTLQEQCPGVLRVRAPHQKGAQPDRWPSHYQLDGIKLAHASEAKAACQNKSQMPHVLK
jgi:hypothetical protein